MMLENVQEGIFGLKNLATGLVVESTADGSVRTADYNENGYQQWRFVKVEYGCFSLKNVATGKYLDSNAEGKVYTL